MQPAPRSSGDLIADRRYQLAVALAEGGDFAAAKDVLEQTIERVPSWHFVWLRLAQTLEALGEIAPALSAYRRAAELDTADECGVILHLAHLGAMPAPKSASERYVATLFDHYAGSFEEHLLGALAYRGPEQLEAIVAQHAKDGFAHTLDLGCGTGLCGVHFRSMSQMLSGVDLSTRMLAEARAKTVYDHLHVDSIAHHLEEVPQESVDLLLAADVFIYIGDLDVLFAAARRVLLEGGLFAFTVQSADLGNRDEGFWIGADLRYAHDPRYVRAVAEHHGFALRAMKSQAARQERGIAVPGLVVLLERQA